MTPLKHILRSKTFWFNVFTLALSLAGFLPPKWAGIVLPIGNIGLRIVTTEGITIFEQDQS